MQVYYSIDRSFAIYSGLKLNIGYRKRVGHQQFISFCAGINYVFFIPQFFDYSISSSTNQQVYRLFQASTNTNPSERAFFAPEVSMSYHLKISKFLMPYIAVNGVYSNNEPIVGREFFIFGKNETKDGKFTRQFAHVGMELGMMIAW
jgi:hypothetical protein